MKSDAPKGTHYGWRSLFNKYRRYVVMVFSDKEIRDRMFTMIAMFSQTKKYKARTVKVREDLPVDGSETGGAEETKWVMGRQETRQQLLEETRNEAQKKGHRESVMM